MEWGVRIAPSQPACWEGTAGRQSSALLAEHVVGLLLLDVRAQDGLEAERDTAEFARSCQPAWPSTRTMTRSRPAPVARVPTPPSVHLKRKPALQEVMA